MLIETGLLLVAEPAIPGRDSQETMQHANQRYCLWSLFIVYSPQI